MPATLSQNSLTILKKRYLDEGETPDDLWDRVSGGNKEYRALMADLLFLPNSPTLFNAGRSYGGTLSACFVFDIEDCLLGEWPIGGLDSPFATSILGTTFKAACVAKAGGGVGYYLGNIRPEGALVNSTHRKACGPVGVLRWLHQLRSLITQGGKRDLAQMGVLNADHQDILKFIHCKDEDPKALESFNISVSWKNDMLKRVDFSFGGDVKNPKVNAETRLWLEQCQSAWRTGDPGALFWDTINAANNTPHLGDINATNPCGETPNISNEPCNLGSLALRRFVVGERGHRRIDWDELRWSVAKATRFMDDILDWNNFPHPDITHMARATRKLGLGIMGWADTLALMQIPYDSQEAVDLGEEVMRTINETATEESHQLMLRKGVYPAWEEGERRWPGRFKKLRNSTRTSIAPTGTISIIAECEPSIEPHFSLERTRVTHEGIKMTERVEDWLGDLGGFIPKTASEIGVKWHVKHQAAFQKHTCLGVSKTINLTNSATVKDVSDAYRMMWEMGCKGGTVYRDGCRDEQVLVATPKKSVYSVEASFNGHTTAPKATIGETLTELTEAIKATTPSPQEVQRRKLPDDVTTRRHKFKIGGVKGYIHIGEYDDGTPGEVFIRGSKFGSTLAGVLDTWCMTLSNALQHGTPLKTLVKVIKGTRFEPNGRTGNPHIPLALSIPDYVMSILEKRYLKDPADHDVVGVHSGQLCPDCGGPLFMHGKCLTCTAPGCGFSKCG